MRILRSLEACTLLVYGSLSAHAAAQQASMAPAAEPRPHVDLSRGATESATASADRGRAPDAGTFMVGGGVGGGRIADSAVGLGGITLDLHLGYFPTRWLGVVGGGNVLAHTVDDNRTLRFFGAALKAELHPIDRAWIAVGPGYYVLSLSADDKVTNQSNELSSVSGVGGEAELGFDLYRARPDGGLATGLLARAQLTSLQDQAVLTTLGLINLRWYSSSGSAGGDDASGFEKLTPQGLQVSSSCGDPVSTVLSVLSLGGKPCAYGLGELDIGSHLTSFAARLLKGTSYGVFLGRLAGVGNALEGLSVRLDTAQNALQLLHHAGGRVTTSGSIPVAAGAAQRWRVARTPRRALVWLNDRLVVNEESPLGSVQAGLVSDGSEIELSQAERTPLTAERTQQFEALAPVVWPELATEAAPPPPLDQSLSPEPAPIAPPADPHVSLLRSYYASVNNGHLEAAQLFAPRVSRYIAMRDTTPAKIQAYLDNTFPQQFRQARFDMDEATFAADGPNQYSFTERASYYNVASGKYEKVVSVVRVRFDDQGKLTHLWQDKVLERSTP